MPDKPKSRSTGQQPEKKIGPFPGGITVAIWLNTIETQSGPRQIRSVTISPRRYRDPKTGEWRNAGSFRLSDLTALILGLEKAQEYMLTTRLPGDAPPDVEDTPTEPPPEPQGDIPF
ncbi:MAG: hypothetical protein HY000_35250 [Planctomycetes bacterium]|nr:hypothetical protein [Planctomycetota bacterium]